MDPKAKAENAMKERIDKLHQELSTIRTGRANPQILDGLKVEYYGQMVPIKQVAAISVPEARLLEIRPWDPGAAEPIEKAIQKSDLGVQPQNDKKVIRLNFPPMNEDRRKDLAKRVGKIGEEYRVSVRGDRRDAMNELREVADKENMPEDRQKALEGQIQKLTDAFIKQVDEAIADKQEEITTV